MKPANAYPFMFSHVSTKDSRLNKPEPLPEYYQKGCDYFYPNSNYYSYSDFYKDQFRNYFEDPDDDFHYQYQKADITDFGEQESDYPYSVFGLKKSDSHEDMKKAYRSAILKAHPDKGGSADEFRFYQEAWQYYSS